MTDLPPEPDVATMVEKLDALGVTLPPGRVCVGAFGDSVELSQDLLALIRSGKKRAGTGFVWGYEAAGEQLPEVGDIEIVVDYRNEPAFVTRITSVDVIPFCAVSAEYAAIEGEGDSSLEYWRNGHWNYFTRECRRIGREPSEDMLVVCGVFEVLNVLPADGSST